MCDREERCGREKRRKGKEKDNSSMEGNSTLPSESHRQNLFPCRRVSHVIRHTEEKKKIILKNINHESKTLGKGFSVGCCSQEITLMCAIPLLHR